MVVGEWEFRSLDNERCYWIKKREYTGTHSREDYPYLEDVKSAVMEFRNLHSDVAKEFHSEKFQRNVEAISHLFQGPKGKIVFNALKEELHKFIKHILVRRLDAQSKKKDAIEDLLYESVSRSSCN